MKTLQSYLGGKWVEGMRHYRLHFNQLASYFLCQ